MIAQAARPVSLEALPLSPEISPTVTFGQSGSSKRRTPDATVARELFASQLDSRRNAKMPLPNGLAPSPQIWNPPPTEHAVPSAEAPSSKVSTSLNLSGRSEAVSEVEEDQDAAEKVAPRPSLLKFMYHPPAPLTQPIQNNLAPTVIAHRPLGGQEDSPGNASDSALLPKDAGSGISEDHDMETNQDDLARYDWEIKLVTTKVKLTDDTQKVSTKRSTHCVKCQSFAMFRSPRNSRTSMSCR